MNLRDRQILLIALPSIVSNITVPLLGMIDVALVGHMGSAAYIGAVAVGSMMFNLVYWLFSFLRMGTSGMTAQAFGRGDMGEAKRLLVRSTMVALTIAATIIVLQVPLQWTMFWLIGPTPDVVPFATTYFKIVVWGAPASLGLFSLNGWFIGMQNTRIPMVISITQNVVNIIASLTLVYGLGMKIEGVAFGTVIAQYAGFALAIKALPHSLLVEGGKENPIGGKNSHPPTSGGKGWGLEIYLPIFLRTLCLVAVNLYFTSAGARHGAVVLSVNTVLIQLYLLFSYFMDGFAYAGEAIGGRFYGARDRESFLEILHRLFGWAALMTTVFTLLYIFGGRWIVGMLTDEPQVLSTMDEYLWWAWLIPAAGVLAFIWDGIFIGLTATRGMLVSSLLAALMFFGVYWLSLQMFPASAQNHGLWLAQIVYLAMRGLIQTVWYKKINFFAEK